MFTIILRNRYGWTDNLGDGENSWTTEAAAEAACAELRQAWGGDPDLRVVATEDLGNYDLIG
jgi:hypothetical protein